MWVGGGGSTNDAAAGQRWPWLVTAFSCLASVCPGARPVLPPSLPVPSPILHPPPPLALLPETWVPRGQLLPLPPPPTHRPHLPAIISTVAASNDSHHTTPAVACPCPCMYVCEAYGRACTTPHTYIQQHSLPNYAYCGVSWEGSRCRSNKTATAAVSDTLKRGRHSRGEQAPPSRLSRAPAPCPAAGPPRMHPGCCRGASLWSCCQRPCGPT